MGDNPFFEYEPLNLSRREIRLLLYTPDVNNAEIHCKLIHCSMDDNPSYMALSYTWGPSQPVDWIFVNGKRFSVRSNLSCFLNSLGRLEGSFEGSSANLAPPPDTGTINQHIFWIDAVCINQADIAERSHHVSRMKQIYHSAECVLIWLGIDATDPQARQLNDIAFQFLGEMTRLKHKHQDKDVYELRRWFRYGRDLQGESPRPEVRRYWERRWTAFEALCRYEYWTRTWIIQEVLLATRIILCGNETMQPWGSLEAVCGALVERWHSTESAKCIPIVLVYDRLDDMVSESQGPGLRLLLETYSTSNSTLPHDKVYGLLGLAENSSELQVDYSKDCLELYLDTLEHVKPFVGILGFCHFLATRLNISFDYLELNKRARLRKTDGKPMFVRAAASCYGKVLDASFEWDHQVLTLPMRKRWNKAWHQQYPGASQCHLGRAEVALHDLHKSVTFEAANCPFGRSFAVLVKDDETDEDYQQELLSASQQALAIPGGTDAVSRSRSGMKAILCQGGLIGLAPAGAEFGDLLYALDKADSWLLFRPCQYGFSIVGHVSIAMTKSTGKAKLTRPLSVAPGKGEFVSPPLSPDLSVYFEPGIVLYLARLSQRSAF